MKNYFEYAEKFAALLKEARNLPVGDDGQENPNLKKTETPCGQKVLIFAPHPDDEIMFGLLPLRLARQCGFEVKDVAVSLGSNVARRPGRISELKSACAYLRWGLIICGFEKVRLATRENDRPYWNSCVEELKKIVRTENPVAVFAPHAADANSAHMATSLLVREALEAADFKGFWVQTEVWGALPSPNLTVEADSSTVGELISALARHTKEVQRSDYHVRMPSWFVDNVRRGAEIVGGQGGQAPQFDFAELYKVCSFVDGEWVDSFKGKFLSSAENPSTIFEK